MTAENSLKNRKPSSSGKTIPQEHIDVSVSSSGGGEVGARNSGPADGPGGSDPVRSETGAFIAKFSEPYQFVDPRGARSGSPRYRSLSRAFPPTGTRAGSMLAEDTCRSFSAVSGYRAMQVSRRILRKAPAMISSISDFCCCFRAPRKSRFSAGGERNFLNRRRWESTFRSGLAFRTDARFLRRLAASWRNCLMPLSSGPHLLGMTAPPPCFAVPEQNAKTPTAAIDALLWLWDRILIPGCRSRLAGSIFRTSTF